MNIYQSQGRNIIILLVVLQLKNKVLNGIFVSMIFNVSV